MNSTKRRRRRGPAATRPRLRAMVAAMAIVFSLVAGRAFQLQTIDASATVANAAKQMTRTHALPAERGQIADRNGEVLAFTEPTVAVVCDPELIRTNGKLGAQMTADDLQFAQAAPARIASLVAAHLGGTADQYLPALTKAGTRYSVVARQVSAAAYSRLSSALSEEKLIGLAKEPAPTRRYPSGTLAANLLGYVGYAPNESGGSYTIKGASGLELALDATLTGTDGRESYDTSPNGRIPLGTNVLVPAVDGQDYRLTIDAGLQLQVEQILADRVTNARADWGTAVVMNVATGELLSLANYPSFDPNDARSANPDDLGNRAITDPYTPGSVEKTLTYAALLNEGLTHPKDVVSVPSKIKSGSDWISDAWSHGTIDLYAQGIIAKSSNIGMIKLARKMSKEKLHDYLTSFGLGSKTGIGLPGEAAGKLPGADMPDYSRDGVAFGGSALLVTTVQEAAAVASVTNGGVYHQPTIVKSTTLADGTVQDVPSAEPRRVVTAETSTQVVSAMEAMAVNAPRGVFAVPGYRVGTKTGTAKLYNSDCRCFRGYTTSTIGVGPVEEPQLLVYVVINNPRNGSSGQAVAGPAWKSVMTVALARYAIAPSTTKTPDLPVGPPARK